MSDQEGGCPVERALAHHAVYCSNLWNRTIRLNERLDLAGGTAAYERERIRKLMRILGILLKGKLGGQRPLATIVAFSKVTVADALDEAAVAFGGDPRSYRRREVRADTPMRRRYQLARSGRMERRPAPRVIPAPPATRRAPSSAIPATAPGARSA